MESRLGGATVVLSESRLGGVTVVLSESRLGGVTVVLFRGSAFGARTTSELSQVSGILFGRATMVAMIVFDPCISLLSRIHVGAHVFRS